MKKAILALTICALCSGICVTETANAALTFEQLDAMREVNEIAIKQYNSNRTPETTAAVIQTDTIYRQALKDYAYQTAHPQKTPQLTPTPRPQSTPVVQLVPTVQQQTPQATPPRPQSTPVVQLVPTVQQQTPQATPPRPQSVPVAQRVPVAIQATPAAVPSKLINIPAPKMLKGAVHADPVVTYNATSTIANNAVKGTVHADPIIERETQIDAQNDANHAALVATNKRAAANTAELANHEGRINALESSTSSKFADLNKEVDDNRKRASAGIAGVAAMANIPQVIQGQTFAVGAGVGETDGESAVAVGFSSRASEHVVIKASVSDDTQQNFVVGGGVSYGW